MILSEFCFNFDRPASEREIRFEDISRSTCTCASAFLKRDIRTDSVRRVVMNVNSSNPLQHMKEGIGTLYYNIEFDLDSFYAGSVDEQKQQMLSLVTEALPVIFRDVGWNANRLNGLREFIEQREFKTIFKGPSSIQDGISARVVCEQEFERTNVFIVVKKGRRELDRTFLRETTPCEFAFDVYRKPPDWISDSELKLTAANGETFIVQISK